MLSAGPVPMDEGDAVGRSGSGAHAIAALVGVLALGACTGEPATPDAEAGASSPDEGEGHYCSDVGNAEGVSVDLTTAVPLEGGDYYATVSVPSLGASATSGFAGNDEYGLGGGVAADLSSEPVRVDVRVVTERGELAYEASTLATPQLFQLNGARCDGENYRIGLRGSADGQLAAWDWQEDGEARDELGRVSLPVSTQCGVLTISDAYSSYVRVGGKLDDGAGGPPPGWNAPYQRGWAAIDGDTLTFQDERGHTEVFHRVAAADAPMSC